MNTHAHSVSPIALSVTAQRRARLAKVDTNSSLFTVASENASRFVEMGSDFSMNAMMAIQTMVTVALHYAKYKPIGFAMGDPPTLRTNATE